MAVTENSYTGNGSTTNYSFTFPYLKSTDVTVQVDQVVTTAWTFANATTVQFNTAPANGAKIKILRDTTVDNLTATFYAGSAIKSEDLNDNFTQNLYVTQEVGNRSFENTGTSTMIGNLNMGEDTNVVFEGSTDNAYETTLTVADPTADRTITLPNVTGTVVTTGDTGTVNATMLAANSVDSSELVDGSVDLSHMSANSVDSDQYVDGSIDLVHMSANSVDSDQYVDGSIDLVHMSANSVDSDQYVDGSIDLIHMSANSVDSDQYVDGSIDLAHMSANSVDSDQYVDGSIDHVHLANDIIDGDNIQDDVINSEHIAAGAVDLEHMSANSVDSDQYVDGSIDRIHLEADIIDGTKLADNAVGTEHIADAELTTLAGMQSATASILAANTDLTATIAEINAVVDGKTVQTTISDTDASYPTSGAVVDYVAAQIAPIGGLEVIPTKAAFPETQPASGVVISIADAGGVAFNGSGTSTTSETVDTDTTVTVNNAPSSLYGETLAVGVGMQVSSTGSSHTYNYHKILAKEADVKQLSDDINDFNSRYRVNAGEPSSNNDDGDLCFDTNADKMKVYDATASAWKEVTSSGDFKFLVPVDAGTTTAATWDGNDTAFDLKEGTNSGSAASVTSVYQLIVSLNGVIQKPNAGNWSPSYEGFHLQDSDTIRFCTAPPTGSSVFIIQVGSAITPTTPADNTVSAAKIQSGAVTEPKLSITNSPTANYVLMTDGSGNMSWSNRVGIFDGSKVGSYGTAVGGGGNTDAAYMDQYGISLSKTSYGNSEIRFLGTTVNDYVAFKCDGTFSGTTTFVFPDGDGSADQVLKTDGSGNLDWVDVSDTPTTTRGDIIRRGASADERLAKGTSGQVLTMGADDPAWADAAGGGAVGGGSDKIFIENGQTVTTSYTIGTEFGAACNALSAGPITINNSVVVTIDSGDNWTIV